ncbi:DNA-directed RNA polymerase specialized sigma24 family protein [Saccharothrix variisporea]|uniref:DNA-directed RNA polymerase specialized sigma24 family protein n=1 Tax=Saccharothrix variisporea TaxID=543527 RepID=A0A495XAA1_9PSEU|nr:DNA-directed RNA polymerase specialized sigma24 family protein [Saccharothrix variisporea]
MPIDWLADHRSDGERLDRLLGDRSLVARLRSSGFSGVEWDRFAEELARYGLAVLNAWMYNGLIFERVKTRAHGALPPLPDGGWSAEDRVDIAHDTVIAALGNFRDNVLVRGRWDPTRGASLKTFFIGQCLWCFSNPYRIWRKGVVSRLAHLRDLPDDADQWIARTRGPEGTSLVRDDVRQALAGLPDDRTRSVVLLTAMDFTQAEIARKLSMTPKAVEMVVRRHRLRTEGNRDEAS